MSKIVKKKKAFHENPSDGKTISMIAFQQIATFPRYSSFDFIIFLEENLETMLTNNNSQCFHACMCTSFYVWVFVKRSNFNSFVIKIKCGFNRKAK